MDDNLIPLFGMFCVFGLPVLGWIVSRMMKHRERMEMLRRGIVPPPDGRGWRRHDRGMAWSQPPPIYNAYEEDPSSAQSTLRRGIITAMVGFALLIGLSFIGYNGGDGPFAPASIRPGPWLLGGLIPMFVGVAQIIIALLSGAVLTLRMPPPQSGPFAPPPPPGQRPYGAPEPGRPGTRYEELARPVPPPDRT